MFLITILCKETVSGGSNGLSFADLRERAINNSLGPRDIPITQIQLQDDAAIDGFNIVKNVDYITDRVFQATRLLPNPTNTALITPASLAINTLSTTINDLVNNPLIINNGSQCTIPSNTLFKVDNSALSIYSQADLSVLNSYDNTTKTNLVNQNYFYYNPYYYCLRLL